MNDVTVRRILGHVGGSRSFFHKTMGHTETEPGILGVVKAP